eukprot:8290812-Pyramimonas_sp.AAC.1
MSTPSIHSAPTFQVRRPLSLRPLGRSPHASSPPGGGRGGEGEGGRGLGKRGERRRGGRGGERTRRGEEEAEEEWGLDGYPSVWGTPGRRR